jgi:tetratricopeptide (TPR) repeat protein
MFRSITFLLALAALIHGADGRVLAQNEKQRVGSKGGASVGTAESDYQKGNAAFDRGEWDRAKSHYDSALRRTADHVPSLLNRGRVALATGKVNDAAEDFRKVVELKPDLPVGRTFLAAALLDQGKHADAIVQAGKSVELDAKQAFAWYIRGTARIHKEDYRKAIDDLDEAAKLVPNDALVHNNRGIAWQKLGDEAKAKADFAIRDRLNAKQAAKQKMEQALAHHDRIDFHVKSLQNRRLPPMVRGGPQGIPVQVVPQVPPELLRLRDEAWHAYLEACKVYNDIP